MFGGKGSAVASLQADCGRGRVAKMCASTVCFLASAILMCAGCGKGGENDAAAMEEVFAHDLQDAEQSGELIVGTIAGPETYYLSHGKEFGLHFGMAEDFANSLGLRLRVENVADSTTLVALLDSGRVDLLAYPFDGEETDSAYSVFEPTGWLLRSGSPLLAEALKNWFKEGKKEDVKRAQAEARNLPYVTRHARAQVAARRSGRISGYDGLFKKYAQRYGWDWRLLAAVCYQESAFDPEATSWAGARGLMQIMPSTADRLGLERGKLTDPEANIEAGSRYLAQLERKFDDVPNRAERRLFALAAYNGGFNHIRDAMRLADKYGGSSKRWSSVRKYVLLLQKRGYYQDPVVRYGYMIGSETAAYVNAIEARYRDYCGVAASSTGGGGVREPDKSVKRNRFSSPQEILGREDTLFSIEGKE